MEKDIFEKERELINEKKYLKYGKNVIHLNHIGIFDKVDLQELSEKLFISNLELSSFNCSGITTNSLDEFNFITYLSLSHPLIIELLKGLGTNVLWDVIKQTIFAVRNKIQGKTYFKVTSNSTQEKEITLGIKFILDKNTSFDFELKGDFSDEIISESLDKILELLRTQKTNPQYEHPKYLKYSKKENKWISLNILDEIKKKHKNDKTT